MSRQTTSHPIAAVDHLPGLRRRTVLTGVAWSAPVIAIGAPALAAVGSQTPSNTVCSIAYYAGSVDHQQTKVHISATQENGTIPAGTVLYWTVAVSELNSTRPVATSASGDWTLDVSAASTSGNTKTWTVTATAVRDVSATSLPDCDITLEWMSADSTQHGFLSDGVRMTINNWGANDPSASGESMPETVLSFDIPSRRTEDLGADGYTEEELGDVTGHLWIASSNTPKYPTVYWSTDGVEASGADGSYQTSDWHNAKYGGTANSGTAIVSAPVAVVTIGGHVFARSN